MKYHIAAAAVAISALVLPVSEASAASVLTDGAVFDSFTSGGPAVRVRSQNTGGELYVGRGDLGLSNPPAPESARVESNISLGATQSFSLDWNQVTGVLTGSIGDTSLTFSDFTLPAGGFNALQISITGPNNNTTPATLFTLTDVTFGTMSLGDFAGNAAGEPRETVSWVVDGLDAFRSVSLQGTLNYFGPSGNVSAEAARVEFKFGDVEPGPNGVGVIPLPAAGWLLLSGLAGLGVIARRKRATA